MLYFILSILKIGLVYKKKQNENRPVKVTNKKQNVVAVFGFL